MPVITPLSAMETDPILSAQMSWAQARINLIVVKPDLDEAQLRKLSVRLYSVVLR